MNDFTVAFWIKVDAVTQANSYVTARYGGGSGVQLSALYGYVDDVELFRSGTGDGPNPRTGSQIDLDTDWHHVAYTRTGTDYDYYLDGTKTDIGTLSGSYTTLANLVIGNEAGGSATLDGKLDDVAWFDEGLNSTQINTIMGGELEFGEFGGERFGAVFAADC